MSRPYSLPTSAISCEHCGKSSSLICHSLSLCLGCLRSGYPRLQPAIAEAHRKAQQPFHLPAEPPLRHEGVACHLCLNECRMATAERSYCGLRYNKNRHLAGASADKANVSWYHDHLPTNCVADWVCQGGSENGYPQFSRRQRPEFGYKNLAVFYQACSFDCLFCQNWHYRQLALHQGG